MTYSEALVRGVHVFELAAVVVLVVGLAWSVMVAAVSWLRHREGMRAVKALRSSFGTMLLLSLEILIAADLIKTVAVRTSLANVAALGLIVLIRTFLSFSLEIEIEGVPPWRRRLATGVGRAAAALRGRPADGDADQPHG